MARSPNLDKHSYSDLLALRQEVEALIVQKQAEEKTALKQKLADLAREQGFELSDIIGRTGRRGAVAVKYRDPDNPTDTWTGRGRMPRWMTAALKKRGTKRDDFLI